MLAVAATIELTLQGLRALFPLGYHLVGSLGFVLTPVVLLAVFLAPLLYVPLRRLLGTRAALVATVALVVARLVLQVGPTLPTAVASVMVGLVALAAVLPRAAGHRYGPDVLAAGTLVGLGLDVALRAWRVTDDVVWSSGWESWIDPSLLIPVVLLLGTARALADGPDRSAPAWTWHVLAMPALLLWTSLAFVGSSGDVPLAVATLLLLLGVAGAMAVLALPAARRPWPVSAAALLVAALAMPRLSGWPVLVLAVAATIAAPLLLREAAALVVHRPFSAARHAASSTAGAMTMFVLLLLYPLHYEIPLPVSNAWLPAAAVVLACVPLVWRMRTGTAEDDPAPVREFAEPSRLHVPALALVSVGAPVLALLVHLGMVGGSPAPGPDPSLVASQPTEGEVRIATYNVGQGQDAATGRLAMRQVAQVVVALDADVVALQEVARGWPLTAMTDMDAWLHAHTDLTVVYAAAADRQFGNALVSRVPLAEVRVLDLGQGGGAQRRSALSAVLPDGLLVYGAHLQARNTPQAESTRLEQMRAIVDDWDGRPATVVAGDLNPRNEYVDDSEQPPKVITNLEVLVDAGLVTTQPTQVCTEPTSNDNCSDYVFTSPDLASAPNEVVDVEVSDHRPVLARLASGG